MNIDGDFIARSTLSANSGVMTLGFVYLGSGAANNLVATAARLNFQTLFAGGHVVYGSPTSNINLHGNSYGQMVTGTYAAGWTAPELVTPGVQMNGVSTASSQNNANPTSVISGNIATTVANLDAAQGAAGFGGIAFKLGGASLSTAV
jgi:hypothetical protein